MPLRHPLYRLATTLLLALPLAVEALPLAGIKSMGMGGAVSVHPVDAFAPAYNPAASTLLCDRFDIGGTWLYRYQRVNLREVASGNSTGNFNAATDPNKLLAEAAINKVFSTKIGSIPVDFAFSLASYTQQFWGSQYREALASSTLNADDNDNISYLFGTTKTMMEYQQQTVAPALAVRICQTHAFGIAINYQIQRLKVKGIQQRTSPITITSTDPSALSNRCDDYSHGVGVTIGYMWQAMPCLRLGIAFEPTTSMEKFKKYQGFVADEGTFDLPWRLRFGAAYNYNSTLAFAFDYEFVKWGKNRFLHNSPDFSKPFGSKEGPGFAWNGSSIYRLGMEWQALKYLSLRFGYEHTNKPFNNRSTIINTLTLNMMENVVTFGGTLQCDENSELSIFYGLGLQYSMFGKDAFIVDSPTAPSAQAADLKKSQKVLGLSWGYHF